MNKSNDQTELFLSAAGRQRREAILRDAASVMVKHHRMRRCKRLLGMVAIFVVVAGGAIVASQFMVFSSTATINRVVRAEQAIEPSAQEHTPDFGGAAVEWRVIQSDSTATERYAVRETASIEHVSDAELARFLDSIDRPAGVISIGGEVRLTRHVVDENDGNDSQSPM